MAIVEYKDSDGTVHWADENSKAYEKHQRSESKGAEAAKVEAPRAEFKSPAVNAPVTVKPKD
jgi:hypothetical protein